MPFHLSHNQRPFPVRTVAHFLKWEEDIQICWEFVENWKSCGSVERTATIMMFSLLTWQDKDRGWPASWAWELPEFSPGVDGIVDQRFAPKVWQMEGTVGNKQTQDILRLRSTTLRVKLNCGPAYTVWKWYLQQGQIQDKLTESWECLCPVDMDNRNHAKQ